MISEIARRPPQTVCTPPFRSILRTIVPFSEIAEWNSARQVRLVRLVLDDPFDVVIYWQTR
jgi:hypothetical protein